MPLRSLLPAFHQVSGVVGGGALNGDAHVPPDATVLTNAAFQRKEPGGCRWPSRGDRLDDAASQRQLSPCVHKHVGGTDFPRMHLFSPCGCRCDCVPVQLVRFIVHAALARIATSGRVFGAYRQVARWPSCAHVLTGQAAL